MKNGPSGIHPDLQAIVKRTPPLKFNKTTIRIINTVMSFMPAPKTPRSMNVKNIFIPRQEDPTRIRLRVYQPISSPAPTPVLVWFHGGGYLIGNPEMDDSQCAQFVQELGISIVSVDYRLAPKHPFPAALEDGYAAMHWVLSNARELGVDGNLLAIGGASAGGGLAAALAQLAHDRQEIQPVFQLLVYPMLDDRTALRADIDDRENVTWSQASNRFGWESYLGRECGAPEVPVHAVPSRREDLSGLPSAWIGVGSLDIFHDEDLAYAQKLKDCGVACETVVVPGAFHGFDRFSSKLSIVRDFQASQMAALKKFLWM